MSHILNNLGDKWPFRPESIFLLDGFGALLSAFLLGVVLVHFQAFFGIPAKVLYFLASLPLVFAVYDFICFRKIKQHWSPWLKGIAGMNFGYCILSLSLAFWHVEVITTLGWIYLILEILIVGALAAFEWTFAERVHQKEH